MATTLTDIFDLEQLDNNLFRSQHHRESFRNTLFGGQVLSQALMAAHNTVKDLLPHSLHAYFLRPGSSATPVIYDIECVRDGRSFTSRQVTARQQGRPIFKMLCSFHAEEAGFEHQLASEDIPKTPDETKDKTYKNEHLDTQFLNDPHSSAPKPPSFDFMPIEGDLFSEEKAGDAQARFWLRTVDDLPDSPIHQLCALAFASDIGLLATALLPHDTSLFHKKVWPASLDHALWFHQPRINTKDWHLYHTDSPWAGSARAYCRGGIYSQEGKLIASTAQEGLIRPI